MKNRALATIVLLLALALPALAQENPPVVVFFQQFSERMGAGDVEGSIRLIESQPTQAEQLFSLIETLLDSPGTTAEDRSSYRALANFIARVFQVRLQRQDLAARLLARGILAEDSEWAGTPLAGTVAKPTQAAPPAAGAPTVEAIVADAEQLLREGPVLQAEIELEGDRSNLAGRLEDTKAAYQVAERFHKVLLPRFDALVERAARLQEQAKRYGLGDADLDALLGKVAEQQQFQAQLWKAAEVAQLGNLGLYSEAARKGTELLAQVQHPEVREFLQVVLVQVGRAGGQPELVRQQLQGLQPAAARDRFYVESVRFEDDFRRQPDMGADRFLARHDGTWKLMDQVQGPDFDRFVGYGVRIWALAAVDVALAMDAGDPKRAQVLQVLDQDLALLASRAEPLWKAPIMQEDAVRLSPAWNPQPLFSLLDLHLDLAARARETGDTARAKRELGMVEARLPDLAAAVPALEAAEGRLFAGSKERCDVRRGSLSRLPGRAREERGRQQGLKSARVAFEEALGLYERAQAPLPRLQLLPDYALSLFEAGDAARALQVADKAVAEAERSGQRVALAQALAARGRIRAGGGGGTAGAVADLEKGTRLLETLLTELGGQSPEARRMRLAATPAYDLLTRLQTESGQGEEAFSTLARRQQVEGFGATTPANEQTARIQSMRSRLAGLEQERLALANLPDSAEIAILRDRNSELLASTRSDFYARLGDLYRDEPAYQRLAIRPVVYGQIQSTLPEDTVVLQYLPAEKQTYIFVLTREAMRVRRVDISNGELRGAVDEFRARMAAFTSAVENGTAVRSWSDDGSEAWRKQVLPLRTLLSRLHGVLIDPVEEDLAGKAVVAVIPTGELMYLPFSALGRPRPAGGDLEFLAERKQVVTLVKASDLLQVGYEERGGAGPVVAFGNPDGSLAAAEQEVQALRGVFPEARVFVGQQASLEHLRGVVGDVGYLHLATHGVLDSTPAQNHLVLAGIPDGRLTMRDIAALQLGPSTRLVTLSGCQTAMNTGEPETELLQSVADAFGFAGSPSVVASLWRVADESTRDLMLEFYRRLKAGDSRAAALQGAEQALLKDPEHRHPFYWAPFVLIGDWR